MEEKSLYMILLVTVQIIFREINKRNKRLIRLVTSRERVILVSGERSWRGFSLCRSRRHWIWNPGYPVSLPIPLKETRQRPVRGCPRAGVTLTATCAAWGDGGGGGRTWTPDLGEGLGDQGAWGIQGDTQVSGVSIPEKGP